MDTLLVALIVGLAVLYSLKRLVGTLSGKKTDPCGCGCAGCSVAGCRDRVDLPADGKPMTGPPPTAG